LLRCISVVHGDEGRGAAVVDEVDGAAVGEAGHTEACERVEAILQVEGAADGVAGLDEELQPSAHVRSRLNGSRRRGWEVDRSAALVGNRAHVLFTASDLERVLDDANSSS